MRVIGVSLLLFYPLAAQTTLGVGALRGAVLDASDQLVVGATITLTETSKGLIRKSESATDGSFVFLSILAGNYSLSVEKTGFSIETMDALKIEVGQEAFVNIRLHVGEIQSSVTVIAPNATELDAQSNAIGSVMDSAR